MCWKENQTNITNDAESTLLSQPASKAYKRRWWVIFIYCFCVGAQGIFYNSFGPITESAEAYFGWTDGLIGLLANWSSITVLCGMFPLSYMIHKKGIRFTMVMSMALSLFGAGLRCIPTTTYIATWLINLGHILNGIGMAASSAFPALLAVTWFPPRQRTTATAMSMMSLSIGISVSFVLEPQIVQTPRYESIINFVNMSTGSNGSAEFTNATSLNQTIMVNRDEIGTDIMYLMYIVCGLIAVLFLAIVIYFPTKPPTTPSKTASLEREDFGKALKSMRGNIQLWLIIFCCTLPSGIYANWSSVINVVLIPVGVSQTDIGNIGAASSVVGAIASVIIARFSDIFMRHMKMILILLYIIAIGSFTWFILLAKKVIEYQLVYLWIATLLGSVSLAATNPLFCELACECAYPVSEGAIGSLFIMFYNISGGIFLLVLLIPDIGTDWMNYSLVGGLVLGLLILFMLKEQYSRTNIDIGQTTIDVKNEEENPNINA